MIKTLLAVRFRGLFAGLTAQTASRKKPQSKGMILLYAFLYLYLLVVVAGMMCFLFYSLAAPFHAMNLDWLYFAIAGIMALGLAVIGGVFTTQNQLYDAKDNDLLLSMPVTPGAILISRMIPLLALNLVFVGIVMVPATVMYAIAVKVSAATILFPVLVWLGICFFAQAICCLLGWLLHLVLSRMNKSAATMIYLVVFLGVYFFVYSKASEILQSIATNAQQIADILQLWVWPAYAMGLGAAGSILHVLAFVVICGIMFAVAYKIISMTFMSAATGSKYTGKKRKLDLRGNKVLSPTQAIAKKELSKFLNCPIYLSNMGLGILFSAAMAVAGIILHDTIAPILNMISPDNTLTPLFICALLSFNISTCCISTPSVSLEGKNIWILKSLPVSGKQILMGKLQNHVVLTVPVNMVAGLVLAITYRCSFLGIVFSALIPGLLALFSGFLGLWAGLNWAKLDFINEAYPCKQSISMAVAMFGMMGLPVLLGVGYYFLNRWFPFSVEAFFCICLLILSAGCYGFYKLLVTWGVRKWNSL